MATASLPSFLPTFSFCPLIPWARARSITLSSESFRITRCLPHGHVQAVLGDKAKIALRVGRLIEGFKMAKHFVLEIEEDAFGSPES